MRTQQNGVKAPKPNTMAARLWDLCDEISAATGGSYKAVRLAVIRAAGDMGFNDASVRTRIAEHKRYHKGMVR